MASSAVTFIPLFFFLIIALILVFAVLGSRSRHASKRWYISPEIKSNTVPNQSPERYVPGEFSQQMELDMRLPYRRFKQLYPGSNIGYEEYKSMQMKSAFRRSMSSQENKRMVR
jgi:hypothetical protein